MRLSPVVFLFLFPALFFASCSDGSETNKSQTISIDTLFSDDFEEVISMESTLLVEPLEMENVDGQHFAVLDNRLSKILVFDYSGEKSWEFGKNGSGPGEWEDINGPADLNYQNEKFMVYNRAQLKLDSYTKNGEYIGSYPLPQTMYFSGKRLLRDSLLLATTDGKEDALAATYEIGEDLKVCQKVGEPVVAYTGVPDFENQRRSYASGEIPDEAKNDAIALPMDSGYLLFMQALGEIRLYDEEGKLLKSTDLPESVKDPIFELTVERNKNLGPQMVASLNHVKNIEVSSGKIYILTADNERDGDEVKPHFLVYDQELQLQKHFVIKAGEEQIFLHDFIISPENEILFLDVSSSRVLKSEIP